MDPQIDRVVREARARSIDVGGQIGSTSYCETWAVGDSLVMRIPRSEFPAELARGDGPFLPVGTVDSAVLARTLWESSTERQRGIDRGPLARFVDRLELDGVAVALHERAIGRPPVVEDLRAIQRALADLHDVLGYHGHLVPAHIAVDGDRVTFTDPLPVYPKLLGGVGYALPIFAAALAPRDEGLLLRDVAALVSLAAEQCGVDLGWTRPFAAFLDTAHRSRPWDARPALLELARRTQPIADRGWIDAVARLALDHYIPVPSVRPPQAEPRPAQAGTAHSLLDKPLFHAAVAGIARTLQTSPSLFDFLAIERAAALESREQRPDPVLAFNVRDASFAAILDELPALRAAYADAKPVELPPIVHHPDVFAESHALRTLLIDLDRLLAPTPANIADAGGLLARLAVAIEPLRDPQIRMAAARRYVNYVSNPGRG
jgi:hypothetical protein